VLFVSVAREGGLDGVFSGFGAGRCVSGGELEARSSFVLDGFGAALSVDTTCRIALQAARDITSAPTQSVRI
jgi:hypothetical protein